MPPPDSPRQPSIDIEVAVGRRVELANHERARAITRVEVARGRKSAVAVVDEHIDCAERPLRGVRQDDEIRSVHAVEVGNRDGVESVQVAAELVVGAHKRQNTRSGARHAYKANANKQERSKCRTLTSPPSHRMTSLSTAVSCLPGLRALVHFRDDRRDDGGAAPS